MGVILLTDRRVERHRISGNLQNLPYPGLRNPKLVRDLRRRGLPPELLEQLSRHAERFVDRLDHVDRDANGPSRVCNSACDCLANPPCCVGRELVSLRIIEFIDSLHQSHVALLDQVQKWHSASDILLRDRNHQSQICFRQLIFGILVSLLHKLCQTNLLLACEQRNITDFLEVHAHRILRRNAVQDICVIQLSGLRLLDLGLFHIDLIVIPGFNQKTVILIGILPSLIRHLAPDHINVLLFQRLVDVVCLFFIQRKRLKGLDDLLFLDGIFILLCFRKNLPQRLEKLLLHVMCIAAAHILCNSSPVLSPSGPVHPSRTRSYDRLCPAFSSARGSLG